MRVSFDVDDTLVLHGRSVPREKGRFPDFIHQRVCEPLRLGTAALMRELQHRGCSIWIYTTSARTPFEIRLWLLLHGIQIDGIVNDKRHRKKVNGHKFSRQPSKYPPAFGIDLHVDDSEGVMMEGREHGFRVVVVQPDDRDWTQKVLAAVGNSKPNSQPQMDANKE
jgi:hypothetical protein